MKIDITRTTLAGCLTLNAYPVYDERGYFLKTYHEGVFESNGLETNFVEHFFSLSYKNVLRGLHFQVPPMDHVKLVYCVYGEVLDAVVDVRIGSPTYGQHEMFELSAQNAKLLYIPKGMAHGFLTISDSAIVAYKVSSVYAPAHDAGIRWDSVGIRWPYDAPVVSLRDREFQSFSDFVSPFQWQKE